MPAGCSSCELFQPTQNSSRELFSLSLSLCLFSTLNGYHSVEARFIYSTYPPPILFALKQFLSPPLSHLPPHLHRAICRPRLPMKIIQCLHTFHDNYSPTLFLLLNCTPYPRASLFCSWYIRCWSI